MANPYFQSKALLHHLRRSTSRYGLHSPFMYNLAENAFRVKMNMAERATIKKLKNDIRSIPSFFSIDHGSRQSRKLNGKDLLHMGIPHRYGRMLMGLSRYFQPPNILEIGTSAGISTAYLALGNKNSHIHTIEACPGKASLAKTLLHNNGLPNIKVSNSDACQMLKQLSEENFKTELVFIDASHSYEGTIRFFQSLQPLLHTQSMIIFDDIYWSKGMLKAWKDICNSESVTLSCATLRFGIVFFKKGITRQHFNLRM
ncbi:MAG: class I SAM-dependent methyltransferase [Bacteroidales bacterium]